MILNPHLSVPVAASIGMRATNQSRGAFAELHHNDGLNCACYLGAVLIGYGVPFERLMVGGSLYSILLEGEGGGLINLKVWEARQAYVEKYGTSVIDDNDNKQLKREVINARMIKALDAISPPAVELAA